MRNSSPPCTRMEVTASADVEVVLPMVGGTQAEFGLASSKLSNEPCRSVMVWSLL